MKNVIFLSLSMGIGIAALFSWTYLVPIHLQNLGATEQEIGVTYTLIALALTLFQMVGGILADRFGRKVMIYAPTFAFVPLLLLLVFVTDWVQAAALVLLINAIAGMQFPSFSALIAESTADRHRAFIWFEAALSVGAAVGPILGAIVLLSYEIPVIFAGSALILILAGIVALLGIHETKQTAPGSHQPLVLREILQANLRWFFVASVFVALTFSVSVLGPFPTLHLEKALHQSDSQINLLFAAGWGIAAVLSLVGEKWSQRIGAKRVMMWNALLHPAALLLWFMIGASGWHVVAFVASFFFAQFIFVGNHLMIAELTTQQSRGRIAGLIGSSTGIIRSAGPVLAMQAKLSWGDWLPFALAAIWGLIAFLALIPCRPETAAHTKENSV